MLKRKSQGHKQVANKESAGSDSAQSAYLGKERLKHLRRKLGPKHRDPEFVLDVVNWRCLRTYLPEVRKQYCERAFSGRPQFRSRLPNPVCPWYCTAHELEMILICFDVWGEGMRKNNIL